MTETPPMHRHLQSLLIVATLGLQVGCASSSPHGQEPSATTVPAAAAAGFDDGFDARSLTIHKGDLTGTASFEDMIRDLADADVILVGEMHNHEKGLDFIATTFENLIARNEALILSMEFYERDQQVALDDYLHGVTDYEQFVRAAGRGGSNNPIGHLRMIERCRVNQRAVIAANSPRRYSTLARKEGFDALRQLTSRQRSLFEIPSALPVGYYADLFRETMGGMAGHDENDDAINGFLRAQSVWDHTMAASVADPVTNDGASVFHVVGHFHVNHGLRPGGSQMTDVLRARLGQQVKIRSLVIHGADTSALLPEDAGDDQKSAAADYIVYVPHLEM